MNVKKMQKIVAMLMITIMLISMINVISLAGTEPKGITAGDITTTAIDNAGKKIVGVLQAVGIILSVVMLTVIGIKYLMGSAEEKAEYKKTMMPYVIGAALVFAASAIAGILYSFLSNISAS